MTADDPLLPTSDEITGSKIGTSDRENLQLEFARTGEAIAKSIQLRARLAPYSHALDMGCGLGRVARSLVPYLTSGSYVGVDIAKESIEWCRRAYSDVSNFHFIHADLFNSYYNPHSTLHAEDYVFPFDTNTFDVIWSSSLFTHLEIHVVDHYIAEMARVLKPGGRVWNSLLLLDAASEPLVTKPRADGRFMPFSVDGGRVRDKNSPETVIALYKDRVLDIHKKHGLDVVQLGLSNWSGGRPTVTYKGQDLIVAQKPGHL